MKKICSRCKVEKPISSFWNRGGERKDLAAWCKECTRDARYELRRKTKRKIIIFLGGCCEICGYKSESGVSLSIDHRYSNGKSTSAANICQWKWERVEEELKKGNCWLLCMNCHMEEEEKRRKVPSNGR